MITQSRWLPHPWMSLLLLVVWQLLVNDLTAGSLIMGGVLGLAIPWFTQVFWPNPPRLYKPWTLLRFMLRVLGDIITANFDVAKLILGPSDRLQPAFVVYPLELENDFGISMLATTISLTPGTVSADVSEDRRSLLIHGLNVPDEQELIDTIKHRYEQPLMEVFQCSRT